MQTMQMIQCFFQINLPNNQEQAARGIGFNENWDKTVICVLIK